MAPTPREDRAAARVAFQDVTNIQNEPPNARQNPVRLTLQGAGLDTHIPTIPEVRESDIKAKFKIKILTPIEGRPTYEKMELLEKELGRNALAIKVPFGGGKRGCLGVVYSDEKFQGEAGTVWTVPESEGTYPTFPNDATADDKKKEISKFIEREKGIKTVEVVEDLLKGLFLEAIDEDYVIELKEGMREYDGRQLRELLQHLRKYGKMDDIVHNSIMERFEEAPNMDLPIDKYFAKQEECRRLVADTDNPITDAAMVMQFTQHLGRIEELSKKVAKFRKRSSDSRKWPDAKIYFREAVEDLEDENKALGIEPDLQANSAIQTKLADAEQKARDDIAAKMSGSFNALACAAVAKSETIDSHAASIAQLTKAIYELTETNKKLVNQLSGAPRNPSVPATIPGYQAPPPGYTPIAPVSAPAAQTSHMVNTAGVACPAKLQPSGRWHFVTAQPCNHCGKKAVMHMPQDCLTLPQNAERKRIYDAKNERDKAAKQASA